MCTSPYVYDDPFLKSKGSALADIKKTNSLKRATTTKRGKCKFDIGLAFPMQTAHQDNQIASIPANQWRRNSSIRTSQM